MELSVRLKHVYSMADKCNCIADIGTDHGYIPIELIKNDICKKAIASDINSGPVKKARINIEKEGLQSCIECRQGSGLCVLKAHEADGVIIAGMGGNLIRDIISQDEDIFKTFKFAVLQPVQNPEVLRKFIYERGYHILHEDLCIDENKFYEIIKVKYDCKSSALDDIYYEISSNLIAANHPIIKDYIDYKIKYYSRIFKNIKSKSYYSFLRKNELKLKVAKLKELREKCR